MVVIFPENSAVGSSENLGGPILIDCLFLLLSSFLCLQNLVGVASGIGHLPTPPQITVLINR